MRSEIEMYDLILGFAEQDSRIRAVGMEGSRTNPNVPQDIFQDYDISYFVTGMESFRLDDGWLDVFGERIIMQKPEAMSLFPPTLGNWFSYLMLFKDGNRIDLKLIPVEESELYLKGDKLIEILLDKDDLFPVLPAPSDEDYYVKSPTKEYYEDCCNEFWWLTTYVAKGLWRKEILYANYYLDHYLRPGLLMMIGWEVGYRNNYKLSLGKNYKYLEKYLENYQWDNLLKTYNNGSYDESWDSLFIMTGLFKEFSLKVSEMSGFIYPKLEDKNVSSYLLNIYDLSDKE